MSGLDFGASGIIALLDEEDDQLRVFALNKLASVIDRHWAEVSDSLLQIEELSETDDFPGQEIAAFVAAKCHFHLEQYEDALRFALVAGSHFDVTLREDEFVDCMVAQAIDQYAALKKRGAAVPDAGVDIDPALEQVVNQMFARCFADAAFEQAIGIALECHRLDIVKDCVARAENARAVTSNEKGESLLRYCFDLAQTKVHGRTFRHEIVRVLTALHREQASIDHLALVRCLEALGDADGIAALLVRLISTGETDERAHLVAYQVCFDLVEDGDQRLLVAVRGALPDNAPPSVAQIQGEANDAGDQGVAATGGGQGSAVDGATDAGQLSESASRACEGVDLPSDMESPVYGRFRQARSILSGIESLRLHLHVLHKLNNADPLVLQRIKQSQERFNPVTHQASFGAHALMYCGTTSDRFLRENVAWMGKASNWSKFAVVAGMGVVHKGNVEQALTVYEPYLPNPQRGAASNPFEGGGALYGLGLVFANCGGTGAGDTKNRLLQELNSSVHTMQMQSAHGSDAPGQQNGGLPGHQVAHGACLGLGLACMGTGDAESLESLLAVSKMESATAGEAAGYALGLLLAGSGMSRDMSGHDAGIGEPTARETLLDLAQRTSHEKVTRGLAVGLALSCYGREDESDDFVEQMSSHTDPVIRYGGMLAIAISYSGTGDRDRVKQLLHVAVSDVSDQVRRAAVIGLGFLLCRQPEQLPPLVALLAESFNPHVRYGAALATGIACAATGMPQAMALLEPLLDDSVDFVRQGAYIAGAMVLQQESEARTPQVKKFRATIAKVSADARLHPTMARVGSILASGIIDAGGRNACVALRSRAGFQRMPAVLGMALFVQYWYWLPLTHCLSLAMHPTALIGLHKSLKIPKSFEAECLCNPELFAYPEALHVKKEVEDKKVEVVELSTSAKARDRARRRAQRKHRSGDGTASEASTPSGKARTPSALTPLSDGGRGMSAQSNVSMEDGDTEETEGGEAESPPSTELASSPPGVPGKSKKQPGAKSFALNNPCRVTLPQQRFVRFQQKGRWVPVRKDASLNLGAVMLMDKARPVDGGAVGSSTDEDLEEVHVPKPGEEEEKDYEPPEEFVWVVGDYVDI